MRFKFTFSVDRTVSLKIPRGMSIKQFLRTNEFNEAMDDAAHEIEEEVVNEADSGNVADLVFFNTPRQKRRSSRFTTAATKQRKARR